MRRIFATQFVSLLGLVYETTTPTTSQINGED
jgi:hypothetical protein